MVIKPGTDIGRYHILEQLGEGGMAIVYRAYDTRLGSDVAIKVLRSGDITPNALPRMLRRFNIEARKMAQLTHPNIVPVMDFGEFEGNPYLVMRYLPGGTLKQRLGKPLAWQEAIRLLLPIADALAFAHEKGLVHRDIKPSNILITEKGQPMLSDFGVAKVLESNETLDLTTTGMGVGTPEYMAPEQASGKVFDHRVDIYALGVVMYEMLTGRVPFTADTPMAVIIKQATEPLPRPRSFIPSLPEKVERVLFKALAKDPKDRYADMSSFAGAMEMVLAAAPKATSQKPISAAGEKKPVDKRWLFGILGVVSAGMLTLAGIKFFSGSGISLKSTPADEKDMQESSSPTSELGSSQISLKDGMELIYIPEGKFIMGSDIDTKDESPVHNVWLDAYWIDKTEVTNAQFKKCVYAGICDSPYESPYTRINYFNASQYGNFPVTSVTWYGAHAYCHWAGRDLPTEAQWEKAARGEDALKFPWGNEIPNISLINFGGNFGDTTEVGSFPKGASPYGVLDMAGNAWEWVADWYEENYYTSQEQWNNKDWNNPRGPEIGISRVLRGGSWNNTANDVRAANRSSYDPTQTISNYGFRCVMDMGLENK